MVSSLTLGVIGQTGQLAQALAVELLSSPHEGVFLSRDQCDLEGSSEQIDVNLQALSTADVIVIAAAYTQVDAAESHEDIAMTVNAIAPGVIAAWADDRNIPVIYISTDYIFSGSATSPYLPHSPVEPINAYGRSKVLGEQVVRSTQANSTIIRTSWLYDGINHNFLAKMLEFAQFRKTIDVVNDQIGRPTYAGHLAQSIIEFAQGLARRDQAFSGTFHITDGGVPTSWAGFSREIFKVFTDDLPHNVEVKDALSTDFLAAATRPKYSVLDLSKTETLLERSLPDWREGVRAAKREYSDAHRRD